MIHEINASAIIACLAAQSKGNKVKISVKKVIEIGCKLEKIHPSVFVDTDRYAFHSFVSINTKAITIRESDIVIDKSNHLLKSRLNRMLPPEDICKYINEIIG